MDDIELYNPDEIVLEDLKMFHLESMNEQSLWAALYLENGRIGHLNIFSDCGKISTRYEEWDKLND